MTTKPYNNKYWLQKTSKNQKITKFFDSKRLFGQIFAVGFQQTGAPSDIFWFVGSKNDDFLAIDLKKLNFRCKKAIIVAVFNNYFENFENINNFLLQNNLNHQIETISNPKIKQMVCLTPSDAINILNF